MASWAFSRTVGNQLVARRAVSKHRTGAVWQASHGIAYTGPRVMNILLIHQNFPGQFKHLAPALVRAGHRVVAMPMQRKPPSQWAGVELRPYHPSRGSTAGIHPWVGDLEAKVVRGEACFRAALEMKREGFTPEVIVAHHGWGESLFLKGVWPQARLGVYCEFFYKSRGAGVSQHRPWRRLPLVPEERQQHHALRDCVCGTVAHALAGQHLSRTVPFTHHRGARRH
jgi:hypothetical protein